VRLRRLGWAGVELEADGQGLVIDHVLDPGIFSAFMGEPRDEFIPAEPGCAVAGLLTHLHRDHADVAAIERAVTDGGTILRPPRKRVESSFDEFATGEAEAALAASALEVHACAPGDEVEIGPVLDHCPARLGRPRLTAGLVADQGRVRHRRARRGHALARWLVGRRGRARTGRLRVLASERRRGRLPALAAGGEHPGGDDTGASGRGSTRAEGANPRPDSLQPHLRARGLLPPSSRRPQRIETVASQRDVRVHFLAPGDWFAADLAAGEANS
jgi:hypothetical protein